jgi:outer membrane protein assembly factor BamD (BamD/ComL family)
VRRAAPVAQSSDILAEMALLGEAQAAIQRGDFAAALSKLDEHTRSFPTGALGEEAAAARVVALCGAGRTDEAESLAKSFLARHPSSPLAPRVKNACGAP